MVSYINYSNATNITGFDKAMDFSAGVMQTATGWSDAYGLSVLAVIFIGFYIIGSKYTQERAFLYSSIMTSIAAYILVSGNFLAPQYLALCIIGTLAAAYFANRI